jgi:hypothetical protein
MLNLLGRLTAQTVTLLTQRLNRQYDLLTITAGGLHACGLFSRLQRAGAPMTLASPTHPVCLLSHPGSVPTFVRPGLDRPSYVGGTVKKGSDSHPQVHMHK